MKTISVNRMRAFEAVERREAQFARPLRMQGAGWDKVGGQLPRWRRALRSRQIWQRSLLLASVVFVATGLCGRQDWIATGSCVLVTAIVAQCWQFTDSTRRNDRTLLN